MSSPFELRISVFDNVYEPREDSYFLAEFASSLKGSILEIGVGTGIVSLSCASNNYVEGVDINPLAVKNARYNASLNNLNAVFYLSDLFDRVDGLFHYILFNPPYLPNEGKKDLALDGGIDGNEIINRFLDQYKDYLLPGGKAYLLASSINNLPFKPTRSLNLFFEQLFIYEL